MTNLSGHLLFPKAFQLAVVAHQLATSNDGAYLFCTHCRHYTGEGNVVGKQQLLPKPCVAFLTELGVLSK
eukprot:12937623-Prorocentrum_lima.AAC.1